MNTFDNLYSRKSIRSYTGENITNEQLDKILKAAYAAPVGRAQYDTVALTVISSKDVLDKWEKATAAAYNSPGMHPFYGAPTVILVSSVMPEPPMNNVCYSNAAIIVQNMALAATELGIGACHIWGAPMAISTDSTLWKELKVPDGMVPCCAVALGCTDEKYGLREIPERIKTSYIK